MNIFSRLFRKVEKTTQEKVIATVIEKKHTPGKIISLESISKIVFYDTKEEYKVFLKYRKYEHCIEGEKFFYRVRIGDKIKVILVKEYDKIGRVIDYKFELPTI